MNRILILCTLFATQTLGGCAFVYTFDNELDKRIDAWIQQKEYAKALQTLEYIRSSHPQYDVLSKKKQQIQILSKHYEDDILQRGQQHSKNLRYAEAISLYQEGISKLPDNKPLQAAYDETVKKRDRYLRQLYCQLYINKAEWLSKNRHVQQKLATTLPEHDATQRALKQHESESQDIYLQLLGCGREYLRQSELDLSQRAFSLAEQLNQEDKFKSSIDIPHQLAAIEKRRANILSKQTEELLETSRHALTKDNLKQAYRVFKQISTKEYHHPQVREYKKELDIRIHQNVDQGIETGRKLYSQGDIERALAVWNELRELDPENELLNSHIDRAQRVLNKLQRLKKNEPVVAPPSSKKEKS